jgi:hypothetical protein
LAVRVIDFQTAIHRSPSRLIGIATFSDGVIGVEGKNFGLLILRIEDESESGAGNGLDDLLIFQEESRA